MTTDCDHLEVITVLGPISPSQLGVTQPHEHLILDAFDHYKTYDMVIDDEPLVVKELEHFTRHGGKTICDVTLDEIGRNPQALARIAKAANINVVMGCGWYRSFGYPPIVEERTSRSLADILIAEIEEGVAGTGIRAGLIGEIGTGRHHITSSEERVFRAAALAQKATGVAISTHTTRWGSLAMEQIDLLSECGADLSKVIIGHLGDRRGVEHLLPIAERGVYLEVDNIGFLDYQPEWVRADNVAALCREGFAQRVLLSEDVCMLSHLKHLDGKGFGYLLEVFVPMLEHRGVSKEHIHDMLVANPARVLARRKRND